MDVEIVTKRRQQKCEVACIANLCFKWNYAALHFMTSATPQERRPTGICPKPGTPSLQHLHLWPAKHCHQKVWICWRPSIYAYWWRLAGSGRGTEQGHGNLKTCYPLLFRTKSRSRCWAAIRLSNHLRGGHTPFVQAGAETSDTCGEAVKPNPRFSW